MKRFIIILCALVTVGVLGQAFFFSDVAFTGNANRAADAAWSPTNETVLAWWDATLVSQSDDTALDLWPSRNSVNLVANVAPKFRTAQQNGLPAVYFEVTGQYMSTTNLANASKPFTICAVFKLFSVTTGTLFGGTATGGISVDVNSGNLRVLKQATTLIGSCAIAQDVWYSVVITYDGSGNYAFFTNGVAGPSGTSDQTFTGGQVRAGANASAGETLFGLVGDLIYDDAAWSETIRNNFFAWALAKWDHY